MLGLGSNENDPVFLDDVGETRVFTEETIAGVNRVRARDFGGRYDRRNIQVAVYGRWRPDTDCLVGKADVHCVGVRCRMDCDGSYTHFVRCAVDPERDFAAVGDQEFFDGWHQSMTTRG